jgi:lysophospholipid acyltransferase (LPLAT)-like uncharacterized protein
LFFRVLTITHIVNKVRVKYKTKNIKTDCKEVFLATINQRSADIISSRNFRLRATRLYNTWTSGSFFCPFKKIRIVIKEIIEKEGDKIRNSRKLRFILTTETSRYAVNNSSIFNNNSKKTYL